jgi:hypothetical protein
MTHPLPFFRVLLPLLLLTLAGAMETTAGDHAAVQKIRLLYSGNVLAELEPCG